MFKKSGLSFLLVIICIIYTSSTSAGISVCRSLFNEKQHREAYQHCLPLAENGSGEASFILSNLFIEGSDDKAPDLKQALHWLRVSADQGYGPGSYNLAALYERGEVVGLDYKMAFNWYLKGAENGYLPSQAKVGKYYLRGTGVGTDLEQARIWLTRAAEAGDQSSQVTLATLISGSDPLQSIQWFKRAAAKHNAFAYHQLALIYSEGRLQQSVDIDKALLFASESVRLGRLAAKPLLHQLREKKNLAISQAKNQTEQPVTTPVKTEPQEVMTTTPESQSQPERSVQQVKVDKIKDVKEKIVWSGTEKGRSAAQEASDTGLRDKDWLMSQPENHYVMQLIQLGSRKGVERFIKNSGLEGKVNYYRARTKAGNVYVVLHTYSIPSITRIKEFADSELPENLKGQVWYRSYRALQNSYQPTE